ncbi:putative nicotinate-nucleotide adenylyltransferase [Actinomycetota bacterium]|nr:putative nicotinate-nucleotide adenylyltransferase [Actinomycetota bacterium]
MNKIGLLGGTFDPVHNAHLKIASAALDQFGLEKVIFIPTGISARKIASTIALPKDRLAMLKLACAEYSGFEVSTIEIDRPGITYTIDTLNYFAEQFGKTAELFFITGKDTTLDLPTWYKAAKIAELITVLSANRGADNVDTDIDRTLAMSNESLNQSITESSKQSVTHSVNQSVSQSTSGYDSAVKLSDFRIIDFKIPKLALSSSEIRSRIKAGLSVADMVPAAVLDYIREHALYE